MKHARIGLMAVATLAVATIAFAQKADFSGTWTLDPEASGMAGGGAPGGGGGGGRMGMAGPMTVKQSGDTLSIERGTGETRNTTTYKLDGTESKNSMMGRGGTPVESVSTAKWDGGKLVITTKAGENETTQTWSLAGATLTIDSTGGRGPTKRVYKKTT